MAGWVREPYLVRMSLPVFVMRNKYSSPLMEYDDFPSSLHEVKCGNPLPWRICPRQGRRLASGFWGLCHASLHLLGDRKMAEYVLR